MHYFRGFFVSLLGCLRFLYPLIVVNTPHFNDDKRIHALPS